MQHHTKLVTCQICKRELKTISWKHLKLKHDITIEEYDKQFGKTKHSTTTTNEEIKEKIKNTKSKNTYTAWNKGLTKETSEKVKAMSLNRLGLKNPVHRIKNKKSWKENIAIGIQEYKNSIKNKTIEEIYGKEKAENIKIKQSISAKIRKVHGHTGLKHSDETKNKLREITAKRISEQKNKVSMCQQKLFNALYTTNNSYRLEYNVGFYTIDIAIPEFKFAIEVDGDFWHVNTLKGYEIKYESQKKNKRNDKAKTTYLVNRGWTILRIWESDLNENIANVIEKIKNYEYKFTN